MAKLAAKKYLIKLNSFQREAVLSAGRAEGNRLGYFLISRMMRTHHRMGSL